MRKQVEDDSLESTGWMLTGKDGCSFCGSHKKQRLLCHDKETTFTVEVEMCGVSWSMELVPPCEAPDGVRDKTLWFGNVRRWQEAKKPQLDQLAARVLLAIRSTLAEDNQP